MAARRQQDGLSRALDPGAAGRLRGRDRARRRGRGRAARAARRLPVRRADPARERSARQDAEGRPCRTRRSGCSRSRSGVGVALGAMGGRARANHVEVEKKEGPPFDIRRVQRSEIIGFIGAAILLFSLFLNWFATSCATKAIATSAGGGAWLQPEFQAARPVRQLQRVRHLRHPRLAARGRLRGAVHPRLHHRPRPRAHLAAGRGDDDRRHHRVRADPRATASSSAAPAATTRTTSTSRSRSATGSACSELRASRSAASCASRAAFAGASLPASCRFPPCLTRPAPAPTATWRWSSCA